MAGAVAGCGNSSAAAHVTGAQYNVLACKSIDTWYHDQGASVSVPTNLVDDILTYGGKAAFKPIRTVVADILAHPKATQTESALMMGLYGRACNELGLGPTDTGNLPANLAACSSLNVAYADIGAHKTAQALAELTKNTVSLGKKAENASIRSAAQSLETAFGIQNNEAAVTKSLQEYATACNGIGDWHGAK